MKKTKRVLAILIGLLLISLSTSALAAEKELKLDEGDITIERNADGTYSVTINQQTTPYGSDTSFTVTQSDSSAATGNTLTIKAAGQTAKVTLSGVNIDVSTLPKAAVSTDGGGDVIIELKGKNTVKSGKGHAGVEKGNAGNLTIADDGNDGSLEATGGNDAAGIGGGLMGSGSGSGITISGGEVKATGGNNGAGIGGGLMGSGSGITISGGEVKATGGNNGAGIGGGLNGSGSNIIITGGEVTATGGYQGAGIGGGYSGIGVGAEGFGSDITISGGEVKATGGQLGAGIGGGAQGSGSGITISGGEVNATGGSGSAGIGGGYKGSGNNIAFSGKVKATVQGGVGDRNYGAGAGIGDGGSFSNGQPMDGDDLHLNGDSLNVSGLEAGAIIRCYKQGTGIPDSLLYEIPELPTPEPSETPEPPTDTPKLPAADVIPKIVGKDAVKVLCTTNAKHAAMRCDLLENSFDIGVVTKEETSGEYFCNITVHADKYVKKYNEYLKGHTLETEGQTGTITLNWDAAGKQWKYTENKLPVTFTVMCETVPEETYYIVTYTDGVGGAAFANQVQRVKRGNPTPAFNGTPSRSGYTFTGWTPAVTDTVTDNVTYTAQWKNNDNHTPGGGNGGGHWHPTTTPVPVIVIPPKTGDMTIWQSILHFLGIR